MADFRITLDIDIKRIVAEIMNITAEIPDEDKDKLEEFVREKIGSDLPNYPGIFNVLVSGLRINYLMERVFTKGVWMEPATNSELEEKAIKAHGHVHV